MSRPSLRNSVVLHFVCMALTTSVSEAYLISRRVVSPYSPFTNRRCFNNGRRFLSTKRASAKSLKDRTNMDECEVVPIMGGARGNTTQVCRQWRTLPFDEMMVPQPKFSTMDFPIVEKVDLRQVVSPHKPSPVEVVTVRGKRVYIKRDDLLRLENSNVSGNKARKMFALNQIPANQFPKYIISYGGSQSNAMIALAAIVQSKNNDVMDSGLDPDSCDSDDENNISDAEYRQQTNGPLEKQFIYYSKKIPRFLRKNPSGNYFRAKTLGMEMIELSNDEYVKLFGGDSGGKPDPPANLVAPVDGDSVWIPQGGACGFAVPGCNLLATEIMLFWAANGQGKPLSVLLPGGTCSTAFVLHRELQRLMANSELAATEIDIKVVVIPCVGDEGYAERQMMALNMDTGGNGDKGEIPQVLKPAPGATFYLESENDQRYFRFGEPDIEILNTFREMESYGVKVDLLYGAPAWNVLLRHWPLDGQNDTSNILSGREIMYVHSGGLEGISSQLMRYRHKGLVEGNEVQHPERQRRSSRGFIDTNQD